MSSGEVELRVSRSARAELIGRVNAFAWCKCREYGVGWALRLVFAIGLLTGIRGLVWNLITKNVRPRILWLETESSNIIQQYSRFPWCGGAGLYIIFFLGFPPLGKNPAGAYVSGRSIAYFLSYNFLSAILFLINYHFNLVYRAPILI